MIEKAHIKDIPALTRLENICFETDRLSARQFRRFISSENATVVIVRQKESLVGCGIALFRKNSKISRLYSFAIDPSFRSLGLARMLYDFLEANIIAHQCNEIRLEVRADNESAIRFYKKHGYVLFAEYKKFYEDGSDAYRMRKILK